MSNIRILVLALFLAACGQGVSSDREQSAASPKQDVDPRTEFLLLTAGDSWANWPDNQEGPAGDGQPCQRVTEEGRSEAIALLFELPAAMIEARQAERLTGARVPGGEGQLYLLRGFSTTNSASRVKVTGNTVTVHSDALGGLFNLRRHPCVAALSKSPAEVYTVIAYDL